MTFRPFVPAAVAFGLLLSACSSSTQETRDPNVVRAKEPATAPSMDPAQRIAEAAMTDDPSRTDVRAHLVSNDENGAIVEVSWEEPAPNSIEALDDAPLRVVRRLSVRGDSVEAIPPKRWEVTDTLIVCVDGRSDFLSGEADGDGCLHVARSVQIEPTGESIEVPVPGPMPVGRAYLVRLPDDERVYWTVPANACFVDVDLEDGTVGRAIGTCSTVGNGNEEPTLFDD
jgi:hypothetical protein